jgi:hypothetical protein
MARTIQNGIDDGSIRSDLDPMQTAVTLWGSTHGLIQLAAQKGEGLKQRHGISPDALVNDGLKFFGVGLTGGSLEDLSDE